MTLLYAVTQPHSKRGSVDIHFITFLYFFGMVEADASGDHQDMSCGMLLVNKVGHEKRHRDVVYHSRVETRANGVMMLVC
jgi:hypothetical protein